MHRRVGSVAFMSEGRGTPVFPAPPVTGTLRHLDTPDDVVSLMDSGADVIALVREAGATFLAPIFHELRGVVCLSGTPRSHIGIVSREFHTPCLMAVSFDGGAPPPDGTEVTIDANAGVVSWG